MAAQLLGDLFLTGIATAPSGSVRFYQPQTLVPITVWSNDGASQAITQPVQLDGSGKSVVPVYLTVPARMIVYSSSGAQLMDVERVDGTRAETAALANTLWPAETSVNAALTALATSLGGTDGNFKASATGAIARTVQSKLGDVISAKDFGAKGDGVADDFSAITGALTALSAIGGGTLVIPAGTYLLSQTLAIPSSNITLQGAGKTASFLKNNSASGNAISIAALTGITLSDIAISNQSTSTGSGIVITGASASIVLTRVSISGHRTGLNQASGTLTVGTLVLRESDITCDANAASVCVFLSSAILATALACNLSTGSTVLGSCISLGASASISTVAGYYVGLNTFVTVGGNINMIGGSGIGTNLVSITGGTPNITAMPFSQYTNGLPSGPSVATYIPSAGAYGDFGGVITQNIGTTSHYSPLAYQYRTHILNATAAGITITLDPPSTPAGDGSVFVVIFRNSSGGAVTWVFGSFYKAAAVAPATGFQVAVTFLQTASSAATIEINRGSVVAN